jgi:hypothetical protein
MVCNVLYQVLVVRLLLLAVAAANLALRLANFVAVGSPGTVIVEIPFADIVNVFSRIILVKIS